VTESSNESFTAIQLEWENQLGIEIDKPEVPRHDADHFARLSIDHDSFADRRRVAAEFSLPVTVCQHHGFLAPGGIVFAREPAAANGSHAQDRKHAIGYK